MATGEVDLQSQYITGNTSSATALGAHGVWESPIFPIRRGQSKLCGYAVADIDGRLEVQQNNVSWEPNVVSEYDLEMTPCDSDKVFFYNSSADAYTDETADAASTTVGDVYLPPQEPRAGDALYIGSYVRLTKVKINVSTVAANVSDNVQVYEYYNGIAWTNCSNVTDNTSQFANGDSNFITFDTPSDQVQTTVNSEQMYWVRIRNTSCTMIGTKPDATQIWTYPLVEIPFEIATVGNYGRMVFYNKSGAQGYFRANCQSRVI